MAGEPVHHGRLPGPGRAGDPDDVAAAGAPVDGLHDGGRGRRPVLDLGDEAGQRETIAAEHSLDHVQRIAAHGHKLACRDGRARPSRREGGYCVRTNVRSVSSWMSLLTLKMKICGSGMAWSANVVANFARTLRLSAAKANRFCASTCSGVSLIRVTVPSATRCTGFCLTVRMPVICAGVSLPATSGPAISTFLTSNVTHRFASTSVSRKFFERMSASRFS